MLTLLGSLLGFITSAFPQLLGLIKDWQDRKHELAILDRQMEMQKLTQRLEEIAVAADIAESQALYRHDAQPSGVKWVDGLRSSVRPMITYAFFLLFAAVKGSGLYLLIADRGSGARRGTATDLGRRDRRAVCRRRQLLVRCAVAGEGEAGALSRCVTSPTPVSR